MAKEMENMTEEPVDVEEKGMVVYETMKNKKRRWRMRKENIFS